MSSSNGWWKRFQVGIAIGRSALANVRARVLDRQRRRDDADEVAPDITARLRAIVAEALGVEPERIDEQALLADDLGIDPVDVIDLVTCIEARFGVSFPEGEIDALRTVEDLVIVTRALLAVCASTHVSFEPRAEARLRVTEVRAGAGHTLERVMPLTPYDCETLVDDVTSRAPSRRCELFVSSPAPPGALGVVDQALLTSRLRGYRTMVSAVAAESSAPPGGDRSSASCAAALRIARHAVNLLDCLGDEHDMTVHYLASSGARFETEINVARSRTNRCVATFRTIVRTYAGALTWSIRAPLAEALERLGDLGDIRAAAEEPVLGHDVVDHKDVLDRYQDVHRALARCVRTLEAESIERVVIGGVLSRDVLRPTDRASVRVLVAEQQTQLDVATQNTPDIATPLGRYTSDPMSTSVADAESRLLGRQSAGPPPFHGGCHDG